MISLMGISPLRLLPYVPDGRVRNVKGKRLFVPVSLNRGSLLYISASGVLGRMD
jgi:hypothetical protein